MERWEPPVAPPTASRRRRARRGGVALPALLEASAGRVLAAFLFLVAGLSRTPPIWLPAAGSLLILGLIAYGSVFTDRAPMSSRLLWLADAVSLGLLTPLVLFNVFAGSGAGPLLPQEQSVYLQTAAATALLILALFAVLYWRARGELTLVPLGLMPVALMLPALAGAHDDLRASVIASALAMTWLVAAVVAMAARWLGGTLALILSGVVYVVFCVFLLAADPHLASLGGRGLPVALVEPLLLLLLGALLFAPAVLAVQTKPRRRRRRN